MGSSAYRPKPSSTDQAIGRAIANIRRERGIRAAAVSRKAAMTEDGWVEIERGVTRITPAVLIRIADALSLEPVELLRRADDDERA